MSDKVELREKAFRAQVTDECFVLLSDAEAAIAAAQLELDAVMQSVDKWFLEGDKRLLENPATRAGDARELALRAIEAARAAGAIEMEAQQTCGHPLACYTPDGDCLWCASFEAARKQGAAEEQELHAGLAEAIAIIEAYAKHNLDFKAEGPVEKWGCRVGITDLEKDCRCWRKPALDRLRSLLAIHARGLESQEER